MRSEQSTATMSSYKEIAERSGVSIGTVYRVLHDRGRFSPETARRVRRIADELGYKKNIYASNLSRSRSYRIALLMPDPEHDNSYWRQPHDALVGALAGLEHYRVRHVDCFYDEHDPRSFQDELHRALESGPDAMIIAPSLAAEAEGLVTASRLTVPHVLIDSLVPHTGRVGFVGQNSEASGGAAGRLLELLCPSRGLVVAVRSLPASRHIQLRMKGLADYLSTVEHLEHAEIDLDFADLPASGQRLRILLEQHGEPAGWFVSNSNASILADLLDQVAGSHPRSIVGYDLVPSNVSALETGALAFLLSQRPAEQARVAVQMIYRSVILGEHVDEDRYVPIDIVSPQTVHTHSSAYSTNNGSSSE